MRTLCTATQRRQATRKKKLNQDVACKKSRSQVVCMQLSHGKPFYVIFKNMPACWQWLTFAYLLYSLLWARQIVYYSSPWKSSLHYIPGLLLSCNDNKWETNNKYTGSSIFSSKYTISTLYRMYCKGWYNLYNTSDECRTRYAQSKEKLKIIKKINITKGRQNMDNGNENDRKKNNK